MNNIIYEIFDTLYSAIPNMEQADRTITNEVIKLLEPYQNQISDKELEELRNLLFTCTYTAKREVFAVGFCFALELILNRQL